MVSVRIPYAPPDKETRKDRWHLAFRVFILYIRFRFDSILTPLLPTERAFVLILTINCPLFPQSVRNRIGTHPCIVPVYNWRNNAQVVSPPPLPKRWNVTTSLPPCGGMRAHPRFRIPGCPLFVGSCATGK